MSDEPPVVFETKVFGGVHDSKCWQYQTGKEAEKGHAKVVDAIKSGKDPGLS